MLDKWLNDERESVVVNTTAGLSKNKNKGKISQTTAIKAEYLTYLHQLYWRSTAILGDDATFSEVASQMNLHSTVDPHPTISLNKWSLFRWFKKNKGKEQQAKFRPLATADHKQARIQYINKIHTLQQEGKVVGYLDEAWNCLWSRREKNETPTKSCFEEEEIHRVCVRRVILQTNPVKTMFMGVSSPPNPEHKFDGKIAIKRICRMRHLPQQQIPHRPPHQPAPNGWRLASSI
jgi:hypothetical protein